MSEVQQLRDVLKQHLTADDEEIFEQFEGMIAEHAEEIHCVKEENGGWKELDTVFNPQVCLYRADVQQLFLIKEEKIHPAQQEWNLSCDQEDSKDEQEKFWNGQQGQQLEEAKFPFIAVRVKSENDDEQPQSSQVHQNQSDKSTEAEPVASSSVVHRTPTAQTVREDCGGLQPVSNLAPYSRLQLDTNCRRSDSSETETNDSHEWKQTRNLYSGFNCQTNNDVSVIRSRCSVTKKVCNSFQCAKACGGMNYSKHTRMQASEKPFICPECDKIFGQKGYLSRHMRIHTGEKPFVCSECGERFGQKHDIIRHMKIHTGEKPFGCSECGAKFGQQNHLIRHMRIHKGEKPCVCSECGQRFRESSSLKTHMRIHTGEKPFGCSECDKRFSNKSNRTRHMRIHTGHKPFGCSECGKGFGHVGDLIRHKMIHTGEKPFECSECGRRFGRKGSLIRHIRIHTEEKKTQ